MPTKKEALFLGVYAVLFVVLAVVFNVQPTGSFPWIAPNDDSVIGKVFVWLYLLSIPPFLFFAIVKRYFLRK